MNCMLYFGNRSVMFVVCIFLVVVCHSYISADSVNKGFIPHSKYSYVRQFRIVRDNYTILSDFSNLASVKESFKKLNYNDSTTHSTIVSNYCDSAVQFVSFPADSIDTITYIVTAKGQTAEPLGKILIHPSNNQEISISNIDLMIIFFNRTLRTEYGIADKKVDFSLLTVRDSSIGFIGNLIVTDSCLSE